ncbi:beta-N-acetylhexosaminidase [Nonomuraea sp. KC401]|uniref:beta-N-acetylhexosaminidase family protein n=1 Tax=unclassified Nonomuraea TaxID=2593643 RepID=UPI0010FE3BD8|nr:MULTISPECIES: beta-N-acetylglucosaminidase domain-containing protein [unclassified Nonomuraea]NBE98045.1 beta-N-acetylhexosaminidase [Nonomuraea sp. K271]TLF61765.1 beta-N-acetylhexosaminidase [Nonomuraea sp. KC401]
MHALDWIVPFPRTLTTGRSHVDLSGCRIQPGSAPSTATATAALRALEPADAPAGGSGEPVTVEVRVDAGAGLPPEGYTLSAARDRVLIVGADPAGAFYGAQTLLALAGPPWSSCPEHRVCVPEAEIRDWPDLPLRGTIEGFYGTPWTHADRMEHLRFSGRHKLNAYVYAPKDDPFHRERWREPYPEGELARLAELVTEAAARHVRFVFALSPGLSMVYGDAGERAALRAKAEQVWEAGVREFALLFDDIPPELQHEPDKQEFGTEEGASASAHAAVCRDFAEKFLAVRGADRPLTMVPTDYAGTARTAYRDRLAAELPTDVLVWWTGPDIVVGEISARDMTAAAASYGHRIALWDNFPVNDFDFDRVFLGPLTGRATELDGVALEGITANPMVEAAASRIALTTVADYAWHPAAYDPARSHERAVRLLPGAAELLPLVEACSSWPPGADQSPGLTSLCATALKGEPSERLRAELTRLAGLPLDVPGPIAAELARWVAAAKDMAVAGLAALDLLDAGPDARPARAPAVARALARAEEHKANVLRRVVPPFVRAALEQAGP